MHKMEDGMNCDEEDFCSQYYTVLPIYDPAALSYVPLPDHPMDEMLLYIIVFMMISNMTFSQLIIV